MQNKRKYANRQDGSECNDIDLQMKYYSHFNAAEYFQRNIIHFEYQVHRHKKKYIKCELNG